MIPCVKEMLDGHGDFFPIVLVGCNGGCYPTHTACSRAGVTHDRTDVHDTTCMVGSGVEG